MKSALRSFLTCLFITHATSAVAPSGRVLEQVESTIGAWVDGGSLLGAQFVLGNAEKTLAQRNYGIRSAHDKTPVDADTLFCIGSCSKPFASAVLMTLVPEGSLNLDKTIDAWLPEYGSPTTTSGGRSSAPTLRELLCHRGGIYSQKGEVTKRQSRWIRDFTLSLEEAVSGIAREPLLAPPGETFAYSGAGYCVLGRVAEVVSGQSFESLLQQRVGAPLKLSRTTFYPKTNDPNIATGSLRGNPNPTTPHLSQPLRLPLIGGGIYSTASDCGRFLRMVLLGGSLDDTLVFSPETFREYTDQQVKGQGYGLGWSLRLKDGKTVGLSHSGSLASSRALFMVNFESGLYGIVLYTLADPARDDFAVREITKSIGGVINGKH